MYQVTNNGRSARVFHHYGGTARVHPGETATADMDHAAAERLADDPALDVRRIDDGEPDVAVAPSPEPTGNGASLASETRPERAARLLRLESAREIEYVEFFSQARQLLGPESVFRGKTPRKADILAALESVAHQGE